MLIAEGPKTVICPPGALLLCLLVPLLLSGGTLLLARRWPFLGRFTFIAGLLVLFAPIAPSRHVRTQCLKVLDGIR